MFKSSKNINKPEPELDIISHHLKNMGYDLLPYGAVVALAEMESGYNSVEAASQLHSRQWRLMSNKLVITLWL